MTEKVKKTRDLHMEILKKVYNRNAEDEKHVKQLEEKFGKLWQQRLQIARRLIEDSDKLSDKEQLQLIEMFEWIQKEFKDIIMV